MSSKRCRITFRSGDLISLVDEATFDDEASVAKKTRHGKHTRATILRTFLVRRRYWTSLPCVVIPKRILAYGSARRSRQSQRTQLVSTWPSPGGAATAMTDCAVLRIEKKAMMQAIHREHTFSDLFVAYLLERNIRYEEDLVDQLFNSSEKSVARILRFARSFWQGRRSGDRGSKDQSGDAGRDDRHHPLASELFHEPVQKIGIHSLAHSSLLNVVLHD